MLALALTVACASAARAEGILDLVPDDALGVAVVHDLAGLDGKIQRLMNIFAELSEVKPPAPLAFIKTAAGLGEGLNESGDALLALLPGDSDPLSPKPMLLAPVSDYAKFAQSISGDESGEICRVTIAGEEVLVAKRGEYAMLMNVEHRPRMEAILAGASAAPSSMEKLQPWLGKNDFAVVVLPAGVDALMVAAEAGLASQRVQMENQFSDPQFAELMANLKATLEIYDAVLGFCNAEVSSAAVGVAIDDASNVPRQQTRRVRAGRQACPARGPAEDEWLAAGRHSGWAVRVRRRRFAAGEFWRLAGQVDARADGKISRRVWLQEL